MNLTIDKSELVPLIMYVCKKLSRVLEHVGSPTTRKNRTERKENHGCKDRRYIDV